MNLETDIEQAFDYRGDVTLRLKDGTTIEGYLFNRELQVADPFIQIYPKNEPEPLKISFADIEAVELTGKDTAAGRSWEAWLKKVDEAQAQGKIAELYPEDLEK